MSDEAGHEPACDPQDLARLLVSRAVTSAGKGNHLFSGCLGTSVEVLGQISEMLTVVDRPVLQHVVEEAREAGIEHFIF
jgi:dTDP-glucose pyrophosphorylase